MIDTSKWMGEDIPKQAAPVGAPSVEPVVQDGRIETLAMMLRKCAHALKVRGRDDLAADVVGLLRRFDLLGSPLRATPQAQPATPPAVQAPSVEPVAQLAAVRQFRTEAAHVQSRLDQLGADCATPQAQPATPPAVQALTAERLLDLAECMRPLLKTQDDWLLGLQYGRAVLAAAGAAAQGGAHG